MLSHTVLFRLRRPVGEAELTAFLAGLEKFAAQAPLAAGPATVAVDLGLRDSSNPRVSEASLSTTFADAETFAAYIDHPLHKALVTDVLEPYCESWLSVQAELPTA